MERKDKVEDKETDTLLLCGRVKTWQALVQFCIHLYEEVERVCNRKCSHIMDLAIILMREKLTSRINFLKWSGRIKVTRLALLMEEDIKEGLLVKAALLSNYFKRWNCGIVMKKKDPLAIGDQ